jgi:hypothetical protein
MVDATRALLAAALADSSNVKFVLLSESGVPLYSATTLYAQLMAEDRSRINACAMEGPEARPIRTHVIRGSAESASRWVSTLLLPRTKLGLHRSTGLVFGACSFGSPNQPETSCLHLPIPRGCLGCLRRGPQILFCIDGQNIDQVACVDSGIYTSWIGTHCSIRHQIERWTRISVLRTISHLCKCNDVFRSESYSMSRR